MADEGLSLCFANQQMGADLPRVKTGHRAGLQTFLSTMKALADTLQCFL